MTIISLRAVQKLYGGRSILRGIDLAVTREARIGLVGPNGAGKSTLLRLLAGLDDPDGGEVVRKVGLRSAYLPQHVTAGRLTSLQMIHAARSDLAALDAELAACEAELGSPAVVADLRLMERVLARQQRLLRRYEELGGAGLDGEARGQLRALGFDDAAMARPLAELSGGQRKLAALAACLVQRPELLLLDEPETHLDLPHRERLENLIRSFDGAVVIVSHDRFLLDETVGEIVELENGAVTVWPGNYSAYALARELAVQRQQTLYVAQQKEIARLEEAVKRFKLWASLVVDERHIKQARNKQRQIDSMEKIERPVLLRRTMGLELRSATRGGQKVAALQSVGVAFDGDPVLLGVDLEVWRGERVGIVGVNGAGKSVLGRVLMGAIEPLGGRFWIGPSIQRGYFAQGHETLPPGATPIEVVRAVKPMYEEQAVAVLGRFLFTYEQTRQPVRTLSGGERSRLQLLALMQGGANCLVLDEPTNHLDIASAEVLEAALERYDGTVIVISHDRYFLDRIADRIVEVRESDLYSFEGGYSDWARAQKAARRRAEREAQQRAAASSRQGPPAKASRR